MKNNSCDKMIIAILQNDSYHEVVQDLNDHGFYVTVLRSSGGFLKEANATIMLGLNHEYLDEALALLKRYGKRTEIEYQAASVTMGIVPPMVMPSVPVSVHRGGITLFVLDVAQFQQF